MSAVLALKRNSSTVRYCFEADAEPGVLPRALELLAKRGLVPNRVFAQTADDALASSPERWRQKVNTWRRKDWRKKEQKTDGARTGMKKSTDDDSERRSRQTTTTRQRTTQAHAARDGRPATQHTAT